MCRSFSHAGNWNDADFLKSLRIGLVGNKKGMHFQPDADKWGRSRIPMIREQLEEINTKFKHHQQERVNSCYEKPEVMAPELNQKRLELEACKDVAEEEVEMLDKLLKNIKSKVQVQDDSMVLKRGPIGSGSLRVGIFHIIDGQQVELIDGLLCISDPLSPYNGMSTMDYS
jgi:hypothetical protein